MGESSISDNKTPPKKEDREKIQQKLQNESKSCSHDEPRDTNVIGNITKLLPGNTFLMFQTLAPLATNDGHCGKPEIIMTSVMLTILASACMLVSFTDTVQIKGKVYHGLVTRKGLWNPSFKGDPSFTDLREKWFARLKCKLAKLDDEEAASKEAEKKGEHLPKQPLKPVELTQELSCGAYLKNSTYCSGNTQYRLHRIDFLHAVLSAMAFATLTMFTSPVSTCFYPNIPSTVVKTLPLLVGFVISAIFAFSPPARNSIAHPLPPTSKVPSSKDISKAADPPQPPGGKGEHGQVAPADAKLSKDIPIPLALHEVAKSVSSDVLVAALVKVGAPADLAIKAVQSAKDTVLTQMYQELQAAKSEPLAGLSRQNTAVAQPQPLLTHDTDSRGSQSLSDTKQKEILTSQVHAFSTPATSVAQDLAPLATMQVRSQPTVSVVNSQFVWPQGMAKAGSQPAASIAIDIASLLQAGSQMHPQLERQASTLSPEMQAAKTMTQRQVSFEKFQQPSMADTNMGLRQQGSPEFGDSQWMSTPPSNWPDSTNLTIKDVTATTAAGQQGVDCVQCGASQLPHPMEEIVAQAVTQAPIASQVQTISSKIVANTSQATRQVALTNMTPIL